MLELDLFGMNVGPKGGEAIGVALETNTTLKVLDFTWNAVGNRGATGIARGLRRNTSLHSLNLYSNGLDEEA